MMRRRFGGFGRIRLCGPGSGCFVFVARGKRGAGDSKSAAERYNGRNADFHEQGLCKLLQQLKSGPCKLQSTLDRPWNTADTAICDLIPFCSGRDSLSFH
jgi:hypothetical protein